MIIGNSVPTSEEGNISGGVPRLSSLELYRSMLLGEQELESLNENDDNGSDDEKNNDASLLSMTMPDGNEGHDAGLSDQQNPALLKCISCNGVLPSWNNERGDEQSYCLSENEDNLCYGAVRVSIILQ